MYDKYDNYFERFLDDYALHFQTRLLYFSKFPKVRTGNLQAIASHIFTFVFVCDIQKASA